MKIKVCRNTSSKQWGYATLPPSQKLIWAGPLFVLIQLGRSLRDSWSLYCMGCGPSWESGYVKPTILGFAAEWIMQATNRLLCRLRGHHWHNEGYANSDSGGESFQCLRCGESHDVTYY